MKKLTLTMFCLLVGIMCAKAQIGYQISLLNTATGEPRANETVTVTVKLSNNAGEVFYSETKSATTNDFGVLSLSVGNADTFKEVDLTKMPFYIEATANGVMIGKSQILNVPVAEVAKQLAPMNEELLLGTWTGSDSLYFPEDGYRTLYYTVTFNRNGCGEFAYPPEIIPSYSKQFQYKTIGQMVYLFRVNPYSEDVKVEFLLYDEGVLYYVNEQSIPLYRRQ